MSRALFILILATIASSINCEYPLFELNARKIFGFRSSYDSFEIYYGTRESGELIFSAQGETTTDFKDYSFCSQLGFHTIVMKDGMGDGWGDELHEAPLYIYLNSLIIHKANMPYKGGLDYKEDTSTFELTSLSEKIYWKYYDQQLRPGDWKMADYDDSYWSTANKFPYYTSGTRYYRYIFDLETITDATSLDIQISTYAGLVLYVNGQELQRYNLPEGEITYQTRALAPRSAVPMPLSTTTPISLLSTKKSVVVAFEVHLYDEELYADETVIRVIPYSYRPHTCSMSVANFGDYLCNPDGTAIKGMCDKAFDYSVNTYLFLYKNESFDITYTFHNNSRRWVNSYSIASASYDTYGNPVSWTLYGTNVNEENLEVPYNPQQWTPLDIKIDDHVWANGQYKQYPLFSNTQPFNKYWLHVFAGTKSGKNSIAEFQLYMCNEQTLPSDSILFKPISVPVLAQDSDVLITSLSNNFYNYTIDPPLPKNLVLQPGTGTISGFLIEGAHENYTVSATNFATNTTVTSEFSLSIDDCSQPNYQGIQLTKTNTADSSNDSFSIYSQDNEFLYSSPPFTSTQPFTVNLCLPAGILRIQCNHTTSSWSKGSTLSISLRQDEMVYPLYEISLLKKFSDDFYINTLFILPPASSSWKTSQGEAPADWYKRSFNDSTWSTLYTENTLNSIPSTSLLWYFRSFFTISSFSGFTDFYLRFTANFNYTIYINDELFYSHGIYNPKVVNYTTTEWVTLNGPLSMLVTGQNLISVFLENHETSSFDTIQFDAMLKLSKGSNTFAYMKGVSYSGQPSSTSISMLFDLNYDKDFTGKAPVHSTYNVTLDFGIYHSSLINKYCIVSSSTALSSYDPSDWSVLTSDDGQSYSLLNIVENAYFSSRKQKRCFYIPLATKPWRYYRLAISENAKPSTSTNTYSASELFFLSEDLNQLVPPPLAFNTNTLVTYVGYPFRDLVPNSDLYSNYRTTPTLPEPLELDTTTGTIRGNPKSAFEEDYIFNAMAPNGTFSSTTVHVQVKTCDDPYSIMTIKITTGSIYKSIGFTLMHGEEVIETIDSFSSFSDNNFPYCIVNGVYTVQFFDHDGSGWDTGSYTITSSEGIKLASGSVATGEYTKTVTVTSAPVLHYQTTKWQVYNKETAADSNWIQPSFDDSKWDTVPASKFADSVSTTSYYRARFTAPSLEPYKTVVLSFTVYDGIVAYLNGKEIHRYNMPLGDIDFSTLALSHISMNTTTQVVFEVTDPLLKVGDNTLCIEYHKGKYQHAVALDSYVYYIAKNSYRVSGGEVFGDISEYPDSSYLFDNNLDTFSLTGPRCAGANFGYKYRYNGTDIITGYSITTGTTCNVRHPSEFVFEGSDNNLDWDTLHYAEESFTKYHVTKFYSFYNTKRYKMYRLYARSCGNKPLSDQEESTCYTFEGAKQGFQLSEIGLYANEVQKSCNATSDGYRPAMNGQYAFKSCPPLYYGEYRRLCSNGVLGKEYKHCEITAPRSLTYSPEPYVFKKGDSISIVPELVAVEVNCSMIPDLPSSLKFDFPTASISGVANEVSNATVYTVFCANAKGFVRSSFVLQINDNRLPTWVYVAFGILGGIIVIGIGLAVGCRMKSHFYRQKKTPTSIAHSTSSKRGDGVQIKASKV